MGCFFLGKPWKEQGSEVERSFCIVCGEVLNTVSNTAASFGTCTVVVKYHHSRQARIYCKASGNTSVLRTMYSLEKGDTALFIGEYTVIKRKNRKGRESEYRAVKCDMVIPMEMIGFLMQMVCSDTINEIVKCEFPEDFIEGYREMCHEQRIEKLNRIKGYIDAKQKREQEQTKQG